MTTAFLIFGLFFPRLTLLAYWLGESMPANSTPFALDVVAALVAPRLLIAAWAYESGQHPLWVVAYVLAFALATFAGRGSRGRAEGRGSSSARSAGRGGR
jgi:hypothetical protein